MKFDYAIEEFVRDKRFSSASSERHYRDCLKLHAEDCSYRDPRQTTREDVKRTLRRWAHFEPLLAAVRDGERDSPLIASLVELLKRDVPLYLNVFGELEQV